MTFLQEFQNIVIHQMIKMKKKPSQLMMYHMAYRHFDVIYPFFAFFKTHLKIGFLWIKSDMI